VRDEFFAGGRHRALPPKPGPGVDYTILRHSWTLCQFPEGKAGSARGNPAVAPTLLSCGGNILALGEACGHYDTIVLTRVPRAD
jgi:hypothetical protein